jgi:hypothetical protein
MRRTPARTLLVAAALATGLVLFGTAGAADAPTDAEFSALVVHDAKILAAAADAGMMAKSAKDKAAKNAANGIKSSALLVATYANERITGSDKGNDGQAAAVRDMALKAYKAASDGNFKEVADIAKGLPIAKSTADAKKIDVIQAVGDLTPKEVMHTFHKTGSPSFGSNAEADIQANAKKATAKPAEAAEIARRVLALGDISKVVKKGENAAEKKTWDDYNAQMIKSAEDLLAVSKKKSTAADLQKAFTAVNSRCTACHDDDKVGK